MTDDAAKTRRKNASFLIVLTACTIALLMGIEYIGMLHSTRAQAYQTATVLVDQVKSVLLNNARKEQALVDSLKEEYITKAKAISYIIDNNPQTETDIAELIRIASLMSIDEIHIFDETGTIYAGTVPPYYGFNFDSGEQMAYFRPMLENKALSMCQDVTPNDAESKSMMYAICWNDAGTRMIQIGIEPLRLLEELRTNEISEVVDSMPAYDGIDIFIADQDTGEIVGATTSRRIGSKLSDIGINVAGEDLTDVYHFEAVVARTASYCAVSELEPYVIAIVQDRSMVDRNIPFIMMTVLLYLLIAAAVIAFVVWRMTRRVLEEQRNANTDPMTGFFNRRAYEKAMNAYTEAPYEENFVYISADLNGLKATNDTLGHEAGDELIRGAAQCMKQCFGSHGKLYRIGGDEFVALITADDAQLEKIEQDFARALEKWSKQHDRSLTMAYGCVRPEEFPDKSVFELAKDADARMYKAKAEYYKAVGIDRRRR